MYQVRRSLVYWAKGHKENVELLAFLIMLKQYSDKHSTITNFSINKIAVLTHCSWTTCKKYVQALIENRLLYYDNEHNSLSIGRISSGTKHRNVRIDGLDFRTIKSAKDSVRHLIHMLGIVAKRFVKEVTRALNNPKVWPSTGMVDDRQKAKELCKKFVRQNPDNGKYEYEEFGKSYKTIATQFGCCIKTAMRIVKDGVHLHLYRKHVMPKTWFKPSPAFLKYGMEFFKDKFTFITRYGFACKVDANRYSISKEWREKLCHNLEQKAQRPLLEEEYDEYMAKREEQAKIYAERYKQKVCDVAEMLNINEKEVYSWHYSIKKLNSALLQGTSYWLANYGW